MRTSYKINNKRELNSASPHVLWNLSEVKKSFADDDLSKMWAVDIVAEVLIRDQKTS